MNQQSKQQSKQQKHRFDFYSLNFTIYRLFNVNKRSTYISSYYRRLRLKIDQYLYKNTRKKNHFDYFEKTDKDYFKKNYFDNNFAFFLEKNTIIEEVIVVEHNKFRNNFLDLVHYNFLTVDKNKTLGGFSTVVIDYDNQFFLSDDYTTNIDYTEALLPYSFYLVFYFLIPYIIYILFEFFILFIILLTLFDWSILFHDDNLYLYNEIISFCNFYFFSYFESNSLHFFKVNEDFLILILIIYFSTIFIWVYFCISTLSPLFFLFSEFDFDRETDDLEIDEDEDQWSYDDVEDEGDEFNLDLSLLPNTITNLYLTLSTIYFSCFFFFLVEIYAYVFDIFYLFLNFIDLTFYSFQLNTFLFINFSHLYFLNLFLFCIFIFIFSFYLFFINRHVEHYRLNRRSRKNDKAWIENFLNKFSSIYTLLIENIYSKYSNYFIRIEVWEQMPLINLNFVYSKYLMNFLKFIIKFFLIFIISLMLLNFFIDVDNNNNIFLNFYKIDTNLNSKFIILSFFYKIDSICIFHNPFIIYFKFWLYILMRFVNNFYYYHFLNSFYMPYSPYRTYYDQWACYVHNLTLDYIFTFFYNIYEIFIYNYEINWRYNILVNIFEFLKTLNFSLYFKYFIFIFKSNYTLFVSVYDYFIFSMFPNYYKYYKIFFSGSIISILLFILGIVISLLFVYIEFILNFFVQFSTIMYHIIAFILFYFILNSYFAYFTSRPNYHNFLVKWLKYRRKKRISRYIRRIVVSFNRTYIFMQRYALKQNKITIKFLILKFFSRIKYLISLNNIKNFKKVKKNFRNIYLNVMRGIFFDLKIYRSRVKRKKKMNKFTNNSKFYILFMPRYYRSKLPGTLVNRTNLYLYHLMRKLPLVFKFRMGFKQNFFYEFDQSDLWEVLNDKAAKELLYFQKKYGVNSDLFNRKDHQMPVILLLRVEYSLIVVIIFEIYDEKFDEKFNEKFNEKIDEKID